MIQQVTVQRDDSIYEAFPDIARDTENRLVCVFSECTHHGDRAYTRIGLTRSGDRGRTWSDREYLTDPAYLFDADDRFWNCPRISRLSDGRFVVVVDSVSDRKDGPRETDILLWTSEDGQTWKGPRRTPVEGIVPDQLVELEGPEYGGRWLLTAHSEGRTAPWTQRLWISEDRGDAWKGPIPIAAEPGLQLCEGSLLELPNGSLVCFLRENSGTGRDLYKAISTDGGHSWEGPNRMPIPGGHRPVAGLLRSGRVLITHRYMQGGDGWLGDWTQNTFAAVTDVDSCLATERTEARTRIVPLDYDRSINADTGYTGWVQFDDGEIYVVNYIVDDASVTRTREPPDYEGDYEWAQRAYLRGYAFYEDDLTLDPPTPDRGEPDRAPKQPDQDG